MNDRNCVNCGEKTTKSIHTGEPFCDTCTNAYQRGFAAGESQAVERVSRHLGHDVAAVRDAVKRH